MSDVERYVKLREDIGELEKKSAGLAAELSTLHKQMEEVLKKYGASDIKELKANFDNLKADLKTALDLWEGKVNDAKNLFG